ncbi:MAG TPA: M3 family metallopeptidase [Prolixibacteraceae bacterium]|nr:M3 family metallopeptidase [Prolixibacteraceae bacterium]
MKFNQNPLLSVFDTPDQTVPFDRIVPEHYEPAIKTKIKKAKKTLNQYFGSKSEITFKNTMVPLEHCYDEVSQIGHILFNLNSASTSTEIQKVTLRVSPLLSRFQSKLLLNRKLFKRVEYLYTNKNNELLSDEELRLLTLNYQGMLRNGAKLSFFKKRTLVRLQMKLSELTLRFNDQVLDETNSFELHIDDEKSLAGLPPDVVENAKNNALHKKCGGWLFSLRYPDYSPFMKYANNRQLREKMYRAYMSRGNRNNAADNKKIIQKIVNLRLQQAKLLSFDHFAALTLEERMANKYQTVNKFLNDLLAASLPKAKHEIEQLKEFAREQGLNDDLKPWDFSFYSEQLKAKEFGFDEEMLKPYFQLENMLIGVFDLATQLYGIMFKRVNHIPIYHPNVETFEVFDFNGSYLAILYVDLFSRENKQSGAWMTEYRVQSQIEGKERRPHVSICCNFQKPGKEHPTLLTFNEVNTLLHEFGHALHGIFANTVYPSLSGTNVFRDFVELPSQIMENWLLEKEWLKKYALHYQSNKSIPDDLIEKLIQARNFQTGYLSVRQLSFSLLDMAWHTLKKQFLGDVVDFEIENIAPISLFPPVDGCSVSTSFGHIFGGGYAAGYYSYKWAEVLDADAFSVFKDEGIFNRSIANRFRYELLAKGGTLDPNQLYFNFKGKAPSIDALLERSGMREDYL